MTTGHPEPVDRAWFFRGFLSAVDRFHAAALGTDPEDAFHALFEALAWVSSIDERLGLPQDPAALRGLRFVRHRVHHQWAHTLWLDTRGAQLPVRLPFAFFEWRWREVDELPSGWASRDEPTYSQVLAGAPAPRASTPSPSSSGDCRQEVSSNDRVVRILVGDIELRLLAGHLEVIVVRGQEARYSSHRHAPR
jgi:hypothetical protein